MNLRYRCPSGVGMVVTPTGALLTTLHRGKVVVDMSILALGRYANQRELTKIVAGFGTAEKLPLEIRAALVCLAEAGLLIRDGDMHTDKSVLIFSGVLVSVIIVTYNSIEWLEACFTSLVRQTYSPLEIIVVDNASSDGSADWVISNFSDTRLVRFFTRQSLAAAINRGIEIAQGNYFLILNPDTQLEPDSIAQMITLVKDDCACAAVAPKLRFSWAPAFLNGLGNHVGACGWATDNALGHLDLGQFDTWREVPSACFAAVLIPRVAWQRIGALDDKFPLYYEDIEWCYRARLMGYTIRAAPQAIVYHALGAHVPSSHGRRRSPEKLRYVVFGRLRFAVKLLSPKFLVRFLFAYGFEDCLRLCLAFLQLDVPTIRAYWYGWRDFLVSLSSLIRERKMTQTKRVRSDRVIFDLHKEIPVPLIRNGLPELTWDIVQNHYLPLILSGKTRPLPEFVDVDIEKAQREFIPQTRRARALAIWRNEGGRALVYRIARYLQWRLALP